MIREKPFLDCTDKKFSRTLQQAFGPHTSSQIADDEPQVSWVGLAAYLVVVAFALFMALVSGVLK